MVSRHVLAVIAARAGSKGLPGKNTMLLCGHPLLHYTLEAIAEAPSITHIVAITNDSRFRQQALDAGLRAIDEPDELAADHVPILRAIEYAVAVYEDELAVRFDAVVQCEVTTVIRPPRIFEHCLQLLWKVGAEVVTTIEPATIYPPRWVVRRQPDGRIRFLTPEPPVHRQDMEPLFHMGGAGIVFRRDVIGVQNCLTRDCAAVEYRTHECLYIDEPLDAELAEFFLLRRRREQHDFA